MTDGSRPSLTRAVNPRWQTAPLYAAGFTTAFGAHGVAANLGGFTSGRHDSLLVLGALLAIYDGAEVVLKPVFGGLADRIGARPVLLAGLALFASASAVFALVHDTSWIWLARLGQGAGAAAFSPSASILVARLSPASRLGRSFGSYGFYKSVGYTLGPLAGGAIVAVGGLAALFAVMAILALTVALWCRAVVPAIPAASRTRQTVLDTVRGFGDRTFVGPTLALAAATAALAGGVGFLPLSAARGGLSPTATGALVSLLALVAALAQPVAGRAFDSARIDYKRGIALGLTLTSAGVAVACVPGVVGIVLAAVAVGCGTGLITPLAFTRLARSTPIEHLGKTMGAAEIGRECGDMAGPLLIATVATATTLAVGYIALATVIVVGGIVLTLAYGRSERAKGEGRVAQSPEH